ncbi:transcriptional regulator [Ahniella affigens]|uniref:Transcriptional regulator n=1 Tax=Ahniella affigens TaxID=2021234 RepID=A0A2P1PXB7_9GAMM|nr:TfoX/Sxy family protein [Ahniella affigens]AVP99493.1 transcriptional regulator [Ahniella affigens]
MSAKIRNIGPKSAAWLRQVGVRTEEEVKTLGAIEVYFKVKKAGFKASLNLLYALEGAVLDCHWTEVSNERRSELLLEVSAREDGKAQKTYQWWRPGKEVGNVRTEGGAEGETAPSADGDSEPGGLDGQLSFGGGESDDH